MDTDFVPDRPFADYGDLFRWPFVTHKVPWEELLGPLRDMSACPFGLAGISYGMVVLASSPTI